MLYGIDISHYNFNMKNLNDINNVDFVIMKASEGIRFRDPKMKTYLSILQPDKLRGFYHYARPDLGNDPEDEACFFVNTVRPYINDRSIVALDVEDKALKVKGLDAWCSVWAQCIEISLGFLPLIYCSAAETKRFKATADLGCGLWVAKWGYKPTKKQIAPWDFWAIWQYIVSDNFSGVQCDLDQFNGTQEQFMKYCKVGD